MLTLFRKFNFSNFRVFLPCLQPSYPYDRYPHSLIKHQKNQLIVKNNTTLNWFWYNDPLSVQLFGGFFLLIKKINNIHINQLLKNIYKENLIVMKVSAIILSSTLRLNSRYVSKPKFYNVLDLRTKNEIMHTRSLSRNSCMSKEQGLLTPSAQFIYLQNTLLYSGSRFNAIKDWSTFQVVLVFFVFFRY